MRVNWTVSQLPERLWRNCAVEETGRTAEVRTAEVSAFEARVQLTRFPDGAVASPVRWRVNLGVRNCAEFSGYYDEGTETTVEAAQAQAEACMRKIAEEIAEALGLTVVGPADAADLLVKAHDENRVKDKRIAELEAALRPFAACGAVWAAVDYLQAELVFAHAALNGAVEAQDGKK